MDEKIKIDEKYTFYIRNNGEEVGCLRYDEPWVIFDKGSKAILSLLFLLFKKEKRIKQLYDNGENLAKLLMESREICEEKEKEIKELKESFHNLTEHLMETKRDLSFEIAHGLQAEKRIKALEGGIEKHKSAKSQRMNLVGEEDNLLLVSSIDKDDQELYKLIKKK